MPETIADIEKKIADLARKRDLAADKYEKPMLALTYQIEIDRLVAKLNEVR